MSILEESNDKPKKDPLPLGFCGSKHRCRIDCAHYGRIERDDGEIIGMCVLHVVAHLHNLEVKLDELIRIGNTLIQILKKRVKHNL